MGSDPARLRRRGGEVAPIVVLPTDARDSFRVNVEQQGVTARASRRCLAEAMAQAQRGEAVERELDRS